MSSTSFDYYVEFNIILLLELKIDREKKREKTLHILRILNGNSSVLLIIKL